MACIAVAGGVLDGLVIAADWRGPHIKALQITDGLISVPVTLVVFYPLVLVFFAIGKRLDAAR
jgi:hypothetical protein